FCCRGSGWISCPGVLGPSPPIPDSRRPLPPSLLLGVLLRDWLRKFRPQPNLPGRKAALKSRYTFSGKLLHVHSELVCLAVRQQIFPGDLVPLIAGHAAQHATQRRFHPGSNLVVRVTGSDAVDKRALLFTVGESQVDGEAAIGGELA